MDLNDKGGVGHPTDHLQCPLVPISRKLGTRFQPWSNVDSGSLGSRYIGKVLVDCKFRFAESRWGVLGAPKTPAGVIYVDLGFHQPKEYRLASASVQLSLLEQAASSSRKKREEKADGVASHLAVTDHFGPKILTSKPVTGSGKTSYRFVPKVSAMGVGVGGMGVNKDKTIHYSSQWAVKGYSVAADGDGLPGALPLEHSNVVHTGLAFTHDDKPFYLKVEIQGKLRNMSDRLRFAFPPGRHKHQGTTLTLVDLGPQHNTGLPLDYLAQSLEDAMVQKYLRAIPRELPDSSPAAPSEPNTSGHTTTSDVAIQASQADPERTPSKPDAFSSSDSAQSSIVERLSQALSAFPISEEFETEATKELNHSPPVTVVESQLPKEVVSAEAKDMVKRDAETIKGSIRRLSDYQSVITLLSIIVMLLGLFGAGRGGSKMSVSRSVE